MEMGHARKPQKKVWELESDEQQALAKIEENIKQLQGKLKNENALAWQANKLIQMWNQEQKKLEERGVTYDMEVQMKAKTLWYIDLCHINKQVKRASSWKTSGPKNTGYFNRR